MLATRTQQMAEMALPGEEGVGTGVQFVTK